jgi:hypothetical protein
VVRSTIILLGVLALILASSYLEGLYLKSKFGYFEENLAKIIEKTDKREDDSSSLRELLKWWKGEKLVMHAFVPHNEIKDIDGMMVKAEEFIEEDCFILASAELKKLLDLIKSLPENYSFSFGNIF